MTLSELYRARGPVYAGPLPYMARNNAIGLLMRENSLAGAKRRGYKPTTRTTETGLAPARSAEEPEPGKA